MKTIFLLVLCALLGCSVQVVDSDETNPGPLAPDAGDSDSSVCPPPTDAHLSYCQDVESNSEAWTRCAPAPEDFVSCWVWPQGEPGDQCCCRTGTCVDG